MSKTTLRYTIDDTEYSITGQSHAEVYRMFGDVLMRNGIPVPDGPVSRDELDVLIDQAEYA